MKPITQKPVGFPTASEDEIKLWKLQKDQALKLGNHSLAASLQFAIDLFGTKSQGAPAMNGAFAKLGKFTPLTKIQRELNLLRLKKMEAEKGGRIALARELQFKIENFAKGLTTDGTQLYAEGGFVKGNTLMIVTDQSNVIAAPGVYKLDTGETIEVGEEGVILSVSNPVKNIAAGLKKIKESDQSILAKLKRSALLKNSNPKNRA